MSVPAVSIIVPVYNVEAHLAECLDSLLAQTYSSLEVVCVNDGSTDKSATILADYASKDDRIKVVNKENGGVSSARNTGLNHATGEYVLFVDADDFIAEQTCEKLCSVAKNKDADIVVFGGKTFPTTHWADASFAKRDIVYHNDSIKAILNEQGGNPLMCNKMYSRTLLVKNNCTFDEGLLLGEDNAFQFSVFPLAKTIAFIPDMFYFYRMSNSSAMGSRKNNHAEKMWLHLDVIRSILNNWHERGYLAVARDEMLDWSVRFLYNESSQAAFDERSAYSIEFDRLMNLYFPGYDSGAFDTKEDIQKQIDFMKGAASVVDEPPLFTIVLDSIDERCLSDDSLRGLELQTEQRMEILVCPSDNPESGYAKDVAALAKRDSRVRIMDTGTPVEALNKAKGSYILHLYANESIELTTLEQIMELMQPEEEEDKALSPDMIIVSDSAQMSGVLDVFDCYKPDTHIDIAKKKLYSSSELSESIFEAATLLQGNKVFSTEYLRSVLKERKSLLEDSPTWDALYAVAMLDAKQIIPTTKPVLTMEEILFADEKAAEKASLARINSCKTALRAVEAICDVSMCRSYERAFLGFAVCQLRLMGGTRSAQVYVESVQQFAKEASFDTLQEDAYQKEGQGSFVPKLLELSPEAFIEVLSTNTISHLVSTNRLNLMEVGDWAWHNQILQHQVNNFELSISFRIGRLVTAIPRSMANLIKKIRR